jgi:hypothetical protein
MKCYYYYYCYYFYCYYFFSSRAITLLGLIRTFARCFSTVDSGNSVTVTDSNDDERLEGKFAALCHNRFSFQDVEYYYDTILEKLNLQARHSLPYFNKCLY